MSLDPIAASPEQTLSPAAGPGSTVARDRAPTIEARPDVGAGSGTWTLVVPLLLPAVLLLTGSLVGLPFTLNAVPAVERLAGVVLASVLGIAATVGLSRVAERSLGSVLLWASVAVLAAGAWVIAASGQGLFRGPIGRVLELVSAPLAGRVAIVDGWEITNTRFIVGYNGLADLCLVTIWVAASSAFDGGRRGVRVAALGLGAVGLLLLIGTSSRGALVGLLAGLFVVGSYGWRRGWLLAAGATPLVVLMALAGVLDKGLDVTSTTGRLAFWQGYVRMLSEVPLTGVGLGIDTAYTVTRFYEVNPDPERIFYAHNTFVQTYLEQGPLGTLGMLLLPLLAFLAAAVAVREGISRPRRALMLGGLGLLTGMHVHGLTDQVVTTDVGAALVFVSAGAVFAAVGPRARTATARVAAIAAAAVALVALVVAAAVVAVPAARGRALLGLGSLQLNQAILRGTTVDRAQLAVAEGTLSQALQVLPDDPAVQRELAWARLERFDAAGAAASLDAALRSPRLDAFDMLQVAHVYRELGFADDAYQLATRAFAAWGHAPPEPVLWEYKRRTLVDQPQAIVLADQGEAALRARNYAEALALFQQAARLDQKNNQYLRDRIAEAQRGLERYGPQGRRP